jgi:hypothetical protein
MRRTISSLTESALKSSDFKREKQRIRAHPRSRYAGKNPTLGCLAGHGSRRKSHGTRQEQSNVSSPYALCPFCRQSHWSLTPARRDPRLALRSRFAILNRGPRIILFVIALALEMKTHLDSGESLSYLASLRLGRQNAEGKTLYFGRQFFTRLVKLT